MKEVVAGELSTLIRNMVDYALDKDCGVMGDVAEGKKVWNREFERENERLELFLEEVN